MSRDEYNRVLVERLHSQYRWENQPAPGWTVADLDANEIVRTVTEAIARGRAEDPGTRDPESLLLGLGLINGGAILNAAVVLFGKAERVEAEFPQCLLRVAKFKGIDRTEFIDNRQFNGNLFDLFLKADRFMRESLPVAGRISPGLFERVREADKRGDELGLNSDEKAFYDAFETNDSAVKVLGEPSLVMIARELTETVKKNTSIDWTMRESVQAHLRVLVKRILRKYGYPPDKQKRATELVLEQAAVLSEGWVG